MIIGTQSGVVVDSNIMIIWMQFIFNNFRIGVAVILQLPIFHFADL